MVDTRSRKAIERLAASVLSVKPLVAGLTGPIRVVPVARYAAPRAPRPGGQRGDLARLLDRVARQAGVAGLTVQEQAGPGGLQVFERVVSGRLALAELDDSLLAIPDDLLGEVDRIVAETVAAGFDAFFHKESIPSADGVPLNVYCAGPASGATVSGATGSDAIVLVPACGMPAALAESWLRFLACDRRVLTWESRGLFGAADYDADYAIELAAQSADLFTLMDHYDVPSAHVIGLCGGASIALAAAADRPGRISSLSLWHGAYTLASGCQKTRHQQDLIELMALAAHDQGTARSVQAAFCQLALSGTPADIAHLALYPFANPELFYRYCRLNGNLATTDVEQYLERVKQPALVVTSLDDATAHPQGSRQVAEGLRNARLRIEAHGDHSSLFTANNTLMRVAVDFIEEQSPV